MFRSIIPERLLIPFAGVDKINRRINKMNIMSIRNYEDFRPTDAELAEV